MKNKSHLLIQAPNKEMYMMDVNSGEVWTVDDENRVVSKRPMTNREEKDAIVSFYKSLKFPKKLEKEMIKDYE